MDFTVLMEHFELVVVAGCLGVGYLLKHLTIFKKIPNNDIPGILAVVGACLNLAVNGLSVPSAVYGALMGLASTGGHQMFKEWIEKSKK